MKNIVVLTQAYYPYMSPISAVLDKYIQAIKGEYNFYVIAWESGIHFKELNDPHVKVSYISSFWWHLRVVCEEGLRTSPNILYSFVLGIIRLRTFILSFFRKSFIFKWVENASYEEIQRISDEVTIDAVISVSGLNVYSHEAAKRFKSHHPNTKWITFITDPITFADTKYDVIKIFSKRRFRKNYNIEKNIYDSADYNIFLENLYMDAIEGFNQPQNKTIHFRLVLDDIGSVYGHDSFIVTDKIRMVYAGALYREIRNPDYMLSVISKVENVQLDMFVRYSQCIDIIKSYESEKIKLFPGVDNDRYKEMICNEYDILINIGNNCKNQLPSKTLELLSSGNPIINFYYFKDAQYEMIEKYPLGLNIGRDENDAIEKVSEFCLKMKGKKLSFKEVENLYPLNSLEIQKETFKSLIEA